MGSNNHPQVHFLLSRIIRGISGGDKEDETLN